MDEEPYDDWFDDEPYCDACDEFGNESHHRRHGGKR